MRLFFKVQEKGTEVARSFCDKWAILYGRRSDAGQSEGWPRSLSRWSVPTLGSNSVLAVAVLFLGFQPNNTYTCGLFWAKKMCLVHTKTNQETQARSPAIGQPDIVLVFWLETGQVHLDLSVFCSTCRVGLPYFEPIRRHTLLNSCSLYIYTPDTNAATFAFVRAFSCWASYPRRTRP